jgi:LAO/AO transport system kinase
LTAHLARTASADEIAERLLSGDRLALARMISAVEAGRDDARRALRCLFTRTGRAHIVGVTGPPGSGKSTLTTRLALEYRAGGQTVGIVAVDPTSPFTGGALLGDRVRMMELHSDPDVFIRSMATRGRMGGLARSTLDVVLLLDAFGKDVVIVETVGVGQDEVEIARAADTTLVVGVPNLGDDIQAIKAGILEIADVFVVNKADREGAVEAARDIQAMIRMGPKLEWTPPVVKTSTVNSEGIDELWDAIQAHRSHQESTGSLEQKRRRRVVEEVKKIVGYRLEDHAAGFLSDGPLLEDLAERRVDPYGAAAQDVERILSGDRRA